MTIDTSSGLSFVETRPSLVADVLADTGEFRVTGDAFSEVAQPSPVDADTSPEWRPHTDRVFVDGLAAAMGRRISENRTFPYNPDAVRVLMGRIAVNPTPGDVQTAEAMVSAMVCYRDPNTPTADKWEEDGLTSTNDRGELALRYLCEAAVQPATQTEIARRQAANRWQAGITRLFASLRGDTAAVQLLDEYLHS